MIRWRGIAPGIMGVLVPLDRGVSGDNDEPGTVGCAGVAGACGGCPGGS